MLRPTLSLFAVLLAVACPARASCVDEDRVEGPGHLSSPGQSSNERALPAAQPRQALQSLVRDAIDRSKAVGANQLLAQAALDDVEEARAARRLQANLSGAVGPGGTTQQIASQNSAAQLRGAVTVSQLLYDGGRSQSLVDWRSLMAESARFGNLSQQEQITLTTVTLALERSRYRMQTQVYRQNVRKMACLAEALESIVKSDRGRASELVQVRKSQRQAELSLSQTQSALRQVEVRLRRWVGDLGAGLPSVEGLATVFSITPELKQAVIDVERSADIAQLDAQVAASRRYADVVAAGSKPLVSVTANGGGSMGVGGTGSTRSTSYSLGLVLSVPLLNPGQAPATSAADQRARAAVLQRADEVESRRFRAAEVHEQALAAADRARRLADVLRESEQVRNFTLQQWQQLGRRSLFDVMGAENEHYNLRVAYVNALHDVQQLNANLLSLGLGVSAALR